MKIEQLTCELASQLLKKYLDELIAKNICIMSGEQQAVVNGLDAFISMHFWLRHKKYERAVVQADFFDSCACEVQSFLAAIDVEP